MADGRASAADICERLRRLMPARVGIRTGARVCANVPNTNDAGHREGSRGAQTGAGAAPDEDNARPPLSYEPGPAIINSSKHSFSYTQLYVVLSPTKRSPPMSFSMPVMALIAGLLPGSMDAPLGFTVHHRPPVRLVDDASSRPCGSGHGNYSEGKRTPRVRSQSPAAQMTRYHGDDHPWV